MYTAAIVVGVIAVLAGVSHLLNARDDAALIAFIAKRSPVPSYGRMTTISHDDKTMAKIAAAMPSLAPERFVPSFDMYYEAQLDDCDPEKNFVMVGGTNGASHLYQGIISRGRQSH
jgi:hypothetical protein